MKPFLHLCELYMQGILSIEFLVQGRVLLSQETKLNLYWMATSLQNSTILIPSSKTRLQRHHLKEIEDYREANFLEDLCEEALWMEASQFQCKLKATNLTDMNEVYDHRQMSWPCLKLLSCSLYVCNSSVLYRLVTHFLK